MLRNITWMAATLLVTLAIPTSVDAEGESLVCFFEGPRFTGASFCARPGIETPNASEVRLQGEANDWDERICSVQLIGDVSVTVWEGEAYSGPSLVLSRSEYDLRAVRTKSHGVRNWCRSITSYKIGE